MKISDRCTQCFSWVTFHQDYTERFVLLWCSLVMMVVDVVLTICVFFGQIATVAIVKELSLSGLMVVMGVFIAMVWHYWHTPCQLTLDEEDRLHLHRNETCKVGNAISPSPCVLWDAASSKQPTVVMRLDKSPMLHIDFGLFPRAKLYGQASYQWKVKVIGDLLTFTDKSGASFACRYLIRDETGKQPFKLLKLGEDSLVQALQTVRAFNSVGDILTSAQQVDKFIIPIPVSAQDATG